MNGEGFAYFRWMDLTAGHPATYCRFRSCGYCRYNWDNGAR